MERKSVPGCTLRGELPYFQKEPIGSQRHTNGLSPIILILLSDEGLQNADGFVSRERKPS